MSGRQLTKDDNVNITNFHPSCRICFASNQTLMIPSPCNCSGSLGFVHKNCLQRWAISARNFSSCEICHGKYEKVGVLPKRTFTKLFKAFFFRPFPALCKFAGNFILTAAVGYTLSLKMTPTIPYLDDVNGESTIRLFLPLLILLPLSVAYGYTIQSTAISFWNLMFAFYDWWNYSWISAQMSDEGIDLLPNNLSTTHSSSEDSLNISPII